MNVLKYPMITITISFVIGILVNYFFVLSFTQISLFVFFFFCIFIFVFFRARKVLFQDIYFGFNCYLLVASLGSMTHYLHSDLNYDNHYSKIMVNEKNEIIGTVSTIIKANEKYNKYIVSLEKCNSKNSIGKILLYYSKEDSLGLRVGQRIVFYEKLNKTPKAFNPNQFDYSKYLEKQNIYHQVFCKKNKIVKLGVVKNYEYFFQEMRTKLRESFSIHSFDVKTRSILEALILGQRSYMDKETMNNYSKAGVIHILAISGLHIGILFVFLSGLLKPLEKKKYGRYLKLIIIITLLWVFAIITGFSASVARAVTLFTFISFGKFYYRQLGVYNGIAISALALLAYNPNFIFDIGFQLSYSAVISILLFQPFYEKAYFTKNKVGVYFIDIILVSLAAQIGVLPLSLYYFNQLPLLFLIANLLVIPVASGILIIGIITLILNFVFQPLAVILGKIITYLIWLMNNYVAYISKIEKGSINNISFTVPLVVLLYLFIIALVFLMYNRKWYAFRNLIFSILLFQVAYVLIKKNEANYDEFLVYNSKKSLISIKRKNQAIFYTNSDENNSVIIDDYIQSTFIDSVKIEPLQNVLLYNDRRVLVIDSNSVYRISLKPDIVVLTYSPKINLERLISETKPQIIIADNSNPFYKIEQWKATCRKEKIPFHATAEKGFYRLK
jgi:competence protein ComEC